MDKKKKKKKKGLESTLDISDIHHERRGADTKEKKEQQQRIDRYIFSLSSVHVFLLLNLHWLTSRAGVENFVVVVLMMSPSRGGCRRVVTALHSSESRFFFPL